MSSKDGLNFYCELDQIKSLSEKIALQIEELQDKYNIVKESLNNIQENNLLSGQYFDYFLEEYAHIEEMYLRYTALLMATNINIGNIYNSVETLIGFRDSLGNYLTLDSYTLPEGYIAGNE